MPGKQLPPARASIQDVLLSAHAAGISVGAGRVDRMLRRWIGQLAEFLGTEAPVPDDDRGASAAPERPAGETAQEKPLSERIGCRSQNSTE